MNINDYGKTHEELMKHVERKRALRLAIEALPDAWAKHKPSGAALDLCNRIAEALAEPPASCTTCGIENHGSVRAVKDAVEEALAGLPDYILCSRYPDSVSVAVRALLEAQS